MNIYQAGEMDQLKKCWLHRDQVLSLVPRTHVSLSMVAHHLISTLEGWAEADESLTSLIGNSQANEKNFHQSKGG